MDGILFFTTVVVLVFGVLQILLFFKLWRMTNDVRRMKDIMESHFDKQENILVAPKTTPPSIKQGSLVVRLKDEKQMRVLSVPSYDKFECSPLADATSKRVYDRREIELYDEFYKKIVTW